MSHPLAKTAHGVLIDAHHLLKRFGKLGPGEPVAQSLGEPLAALGARAEALLATARTGAGDDAQDPGALPEALELLLAVLAQAPGASGEPASAAAREAWEVELQDAHDVLRAQVTAWGVDLSMHRPANRARAVMHVTTALVCLALVEYALTEVGMIVTAAIGAACCWGMELGRIFSKRLNLFLLRFMSAVAHPHERREVNSATWYTTALLLLALLFTPKFCTIALVVLGFADPAAAFVGRRWGRIRLVNGRSLEGSFTFLLVGAGVAWAALSIWYPEVSLGLAVLTALGAAFLAAITELVSRHVDDNLSIPLAAACGAWLVSALV
jgi:dolichol kinase